MRLRERHDVGPRCPYCREAVDGGGPACEGCGVRLHEACAGELGRCPTMGCAGGGPAVAAQGPVGQAARLDRGPSAAQLFEQAMVAALVLSVGLALMLVPIQGREGQVVFRAVGLALAAGALVAAAWRVSDLRRRRALGGGEVTVQPCPARPGAALRLTLALPPALQEAARLHPTLTLRAELRRGTRAAAGGPARLASWRAVRLASGAALQAGRAVFDFTPPALPRDPDAVWELQLTTESPTLLGYDETFEVPVRE